MKLRMPLETYGLLAVALADAVITVTAAGFDLHAVLRSKIALTTLALMLIRAVLASVEQLHRTAIVVAVASATAGVAAASLRKFYVIDAWALIGAVVQIGVLTRRRPKPEEVIDVGPWAEYLRGAPPVLDMPRQTEELASLETQIDDDSLIAAFVRVIAHHARQDEVVVGVFDDGRWTPLRIACDRNQSVRTLVENVRAARTMTADFGKAPSPKTIATALGHEPFQAGVALAKPPANTTLDVLVVKTKSGFRTTTRLADQLETYLEASPDDVASQVSLVDESTRRKILALGDGPSPPWDSHTTVWDRMLACGDGTALLDINTSTQITYDQFHRASKFVANSINCQPGDRIAIVMRRCLALPAAVYGIIGAGGAYVPVDPDYPDERRKAIFEDSEPVAVVLTAGLEEKVPVSLPTVVVDDTIYDAAVTPVIQPPPSPQDCVYVLFTSGTTGRPKGVAVPHLTLARRVSWFQRRYGGQLAGGLPRDGSHDDGVDALRRRKLGCDRGIVLQKTPFVFGVSEWELFWPLTVGSRVEINQCVGCTPSSRRASTALRSTRRFSERTTQVGSCLAVPPPGVERDPSALLDALSKSCASVAFFAPSQLGAILEVNESSSLQSLRLIVCCGEALPPSVVTQCSTEAPQALLSNVYGPTEADITYWEAPAPRGVGCVPPPIQQVPIGRAVDHVRVVVLNSSKDDVCALGVPGELAFVGDVAFGYLNNEDATNKAFSKAPPKLARHESDRMYRTGDVVRYSGNELRFLGRQDRQIKLRGLRIELGEIESKLNQIQGVKESVCTTTGEGAAMALVAYARTTLDSNKLRDELAKALPKYMVPSQIICVSEFPRTDRGKLDVKKLPSVTRHASEKPSSELEASLATIFAEVLGIDSVGRDDDFETLGGNSLLAGRATNLIRRRVEGASRIPGTTLYKHPTVKSLARVITEERARHVHEAPVPLVPDTTYHARDPTRCVSLLIQILGVITVLGMRYMDWPAWYVLWYLYLWLPKVYVFACVPCFLALTDFGAFLFAWVVQRVLLGNTTKYREQCKNNTKLWSLPHLRWWLVSQIQSIVTQRLERVLHGTRLMNAYYRALGASIGKDVVLEGRLADPPLATIGDRCTIRAGAEVDGHAMCKGRLVRHSTKIGADSYIDLHAYVAPGTTVPANASVGALSTTDKVGSRVLTLNRPRDPFDAMERKRLLNRRTYLGVPIAYVLQALPYVPFVYFLEWWFYFLLQERRGHLTWPKASWLFWFAYPWVWRIGFHEFYFWTVVIYKWVFIGRFSEKRDEKPLRRWLLERLVEAEAFEHCLKPWVSTELLCWRYRFLGCKIGRRVHADFFRCVEFDLVEVEDDVVFGSLVRLAPRADAHLNGVSERIIVRKEANVLDHALVLPGCVVGERAVLGTFSLGAARQVFQPGSVATGNKKGQAVVLRKRPELPSGTTPLALLEAEARRRHKSIRWTLLWNTVNILVAAILYPLRDVFEVCIISCGYMLYFYLSWDGYYAYLGCLPLLSAVTALLHCVLIVLLKTVIIGKFRKGDHGFYSRYHFCWALMMTLLAPVYPLIEAMHGTVLAVWFYRAMGASVGAKACVHGKALEFDLLNVADGASIGRLCDTTCHTVENMVIKLADVAIGRAADVGARSVVMPGASLGDGASLLPHSLVLKGEAAPAGSTYAGLPAEAVSVDTAPNADADASAPLLV